MRISVVGWSCPVNAFRTRTAFCPHRVFVSRQSELEVQGTPLPSTLVHHCYRTKASTRNKTKNKSSFRNNTVISWHPLSWRVIKRMELDGTTKSSSDNDQTNQRDQTRGQATCRSKGPKSRCTSVDVLKAQEHELNRVSFLERPNANANKHN